MINSAYTLGDGIRQLRLRAGLTQPELGKLCEVSKSMISFWETGKNEPSGTNLVRLAKIFNVAAEELFYGTYSDGAQHSADTGAILEEIKGFDEKLRAEVLAQIRLIKLRIDGLL